LGLLLFTVFAEHAIVSPMRLRLDVVPSKNVARSMLFQEPMKTFVVLVLTVTALFLWQRNGTQTTASNPEPPTKAVLQTAPAQPVSQPVSNGDWAKHSIDRAREVASQVQATRRENERP
jgi:hypothetical protein